MGSIIDHALIVVEKLYVLGEIPISKKNAFHLFHYRNSKGFG